MPSLSSFHNFASDFWLTKPFRYQNCIVSYMSGILLKWLFPIISIEDFGLLRQMYAIPEAKSIIANIPFETPSWKLHQTLPRGPFMLSLLSIIDVRCQGFESTLILLKVAKITKICVKTIIIVPNLKRNLLSK